MFRLPLVTLAPLALVACGNQPEVIAENASIENVTQAARAANRIEPGKWRTETTIESIEIAGMPAAVAEAMKQQLGIQGTQKSEACVTREQAEQPPEKLLGGETCRYETFEMKGGKLNAVMACKGSDLGAANGTMRMTISGDYGGTGYDLRGVAEMDMGQKMTMRTHVKGARIGDCT